MGNYITFENGTYLEYTITNESALLAVEPYNMSFPSGFWVPGAQYKIRIRGEHTQGVSSAGPGPYSEFTRDDMGIGFTLSPPAPSPSLRRKRFPEGETYYKSESIPLIWNATEKYGGDVEENIEYELYGDIDATKLPSFNHIDDGHPFYYMDYVKNGTNNYVHGSKYPAVRLAFPYNVTSWTHTENNTGVALVPGHDWYYELYVKNQGYTYSRPVHWQDRTVGCAEEKLVPVSLSATYLTEHVRLINQITGELSRDTVEYEMAFLLSWPLADVPAQRGYDLDEYLYYFLYFESYTYDLVTEKTLVNGTNVTGNNNYVKKQVQPLQKITQLHLNQTQFNHTHLPMDQFFTYYISIQNRLCEGVLSDGATFDTTDDHVGRSPDAPNVPQITGAAGAPQPPRLDLRWFLPLGTHFDNATSYRVEFQKIRRQKLIYWNYTEQPDAATVGPHGQQMILPSTENVTNAGTENLVSSYKNFVRVNSTYVATSRVLEAFLDDDGFDDNADDLVMLRSLEVLNNATDSTDEGPPRPGLDRFIGNRTYVSTEALGYEGVPKDSKFVGHGYFEQVEYVVEVLDTAQIVVQHEAVTVYH
jgi:hypothetical protein